MKAIVYTKYGPLNVLELQEVAKPTPKNNTVLVKVYATTVTPVDCIFQKGDQFAARLFTGRIRPKNTTLLLVYSTTKHYNKEPHMKTTLIFLVLISISVLLSSCASPGKRLVVLHDSTTGDTTRCEMNIMSTPNSFEACVDGYKKVGYKIVSEG